jgi:glutaredoxin
MGKFTMWIQNDCPFCQDAQALLIQNGAPHQIIVLDNKKQELQLLQKKYKWKTIPIIIKEDDDGERFIGGYDDLLTHFERKDP